MNILEKIAGNKVIANLAFKQIREVIKKENISMIVIYVDNENNIAAKQYNEPMAILPAKEYERLKEIEINSLSDFKG